ncbi:hypothetical protein AXG93_107s1280 [Marchantia polymorpha subsp. ruderalis]|uniref:Uncharacterized protein n=1 Tax=Marchantia polymorpha subsp. ruderalis TaxID=1480154 RepID=A0A176WK66_MARPO|nr:hypothetical protein AXG93_107s1280 [Marchantia polymorpha subsp. ruderalis]
MFKNAFIGPIPEEILKFENLYSLDLSGNNSSQGLPTELGKLQSLKTLYLNDKSLSGAIADTLWSSKLENIHNPGVGVVELADESVTINATVSLNPTVVPGNNAEGLKSALAFILGNPDRKARSKFY